MGETRQVEVEGRELRLTNLDKVLYPETGFTKGEMVDYYAKAAPAIVPHLSGRASTPPSSRSAARSTGRNG